MYNRRFLTMIHLTYSFFTRFFMIQALYELIWFVVVKAQTTFFQKLRKKEMNTLTYQKHVIFCLKLITFFYLNAISLVKRQCSLKITMLEYLLFLFMYLYNIVTSKIKWCLFKIQNPVDLAFISMLITVD